MDSDQFLQLETLTMGTGPKTFGLSTATLALKMIFWIYQMNYTLVEW